MGGGWPVPAAGGSARFATGALWCATAGVESGGDGELATAGGGLSASQCGRLHVGGLRVAIQ